MDVEYIIHIIRHSELFVDHSLKAYIEAYEKNARFLDRVGIDVFILARFDLPDNWRFPNHRAGMWFDNHPEYSNRLN